MKQNTIGMIGSGSWATAIILVLLEKDGQKVNWWVRDSHIREILATESRNPKHLPDTKLDISRLNISGDLMQVINQSDDIFLAIPSAFIEHVLKQIPPESLHGKHIISAIKGAIPECNLTVSQYLTERMGVNINQICAVSGPSHAEEVCLRRPTFLTMASTDLELARHIEHLMNCNFIHTSVTDDIGGIETACLMKNIYAICAGICQGLDYGDNLRAVMVVAAVKELSHMLDQYKPHANRILNAYCFAGDLLVTCWSEHSRNRALGYAVAQGEKVQDVFTRTGSVAEGFYSAAICHDHLIKSGDEELFPIAECVYRILHCHTDPKTEIDYLIDNVF